MALSYNKFEKIHDYQAVNKSNFDMSSSSFEGRRGLLGYGGRHNTQDYIRDNFWFIDVIFAFLGKIKKSGKIFLKKLPETDIDSFIFRIIENLPYGFFIVFLGFFFAVFLIRATEGEYGIKVFSITTNSMNPVIKPGSLLFTYPVKRYFVGDVITYKEKNLKNNVYTGRILTHRIIEISVSDGYYVYLTKGDNNEHPDPGSIKTTDIRGKVFLIIPFLGYADFIIRTIPGFVIFIVIPSVMLIREARRYALDK